MPYDRLAPVTYTGPQAKLIEDVFNQIVVYPHLRKELGLGRRDMRVVEAALERTRKALKRRAEREQRKLERQYPSIKEHMLGEQSPDAVVVVTHKEDPEPKPKKTFGLVTWKQ